MLREIKRIKWEKIPPLFFILWVCIVSAALAAEPVQVVIEGLEGEVLKNAKAALTLPPGLVQDGTVDRQLLELFRGQVPEKIRYALEPFGYYNSQVSTTIEAEDGKDFLRVNVFPGDPIRITAVEVRVTGPGQNQPLLSQIVASFPLKVGDVLNQVKYQKAKEELRTQALNLGYLGAEYVAHVIRLNRAELHAEVELVLETGPQYLYGEVIWEGTLIYPISFLERYLDFKPGDPYSYTKTYQTQLNLVNSDRFATVTIRADKDEAQDFRVPVRIHLEPSPPKRLRPGVGYATDYGARFSLRYQDLNVFKRGQEFNSDLTIAERLQALSAYYTFHHPGHVDNRTILKAGLQQQILNPYDSLLFTLEGERARSFGRGMVGSAYLQFREEHFTAAGQEGTSSLIVPGLRFSQRRVDDILRPHKGFRYALETRGSGQILGAETNFLQFLGNGDLLLPLTDHLSLIPRMQWGATWQKDPLTDLPPTLRFYAGGDRSVRGYTYQSLGPKDANGNVIGGKHLLVGSLEAEYSLTKSWSLALFYDVGNAFNNFDDFHLAQGAGIGIRYYTVAGPIRVDLARQINVDNPGYQLHITVGFAL